MQRIIQRNVSAVDSTNRVVLRVYNQNEKLKSHFGPNISHPSNADNNVEYQCNCCEDGCNAISFIGFTTRTDGQSFYASALTDSLRLHERNSHAVRALTRKLPALTSIIYLEMNKQELTIAESPLIKKIRPALNIQDEECSRVLAIF